MLVAVNQPQNALVPISELGVVLLPVQGTLSVHDALPCKRDDTLRLSLLCVEAEPMPCRHRFQSDHGGADVADDVIWVPSNGEDGMVVDPNGTIQVYLTFLTLIVSGPRLVKRISVQILHANQKSFLDQALTQFLDETRHARVENQISKWVARADPRNEPVCSAPSAERGRRCVHASLQ